MSSKLWERRILAREVLGVYWKRVLGIVLSLVPAILAARLLGPEGRGFIVTGTTLVGTVAEIGGLGLPNANTYFLAQSREMLPQLLRNSLMVGLLSGTVWAAILWLLCWLYPQMAPLPGLVFAVALVWIPLQIVYNLLQGLMLGLGQVNAANWLELTQRALLATVIPGLYFCGQLRVGMVFLGLFLASLPPLLYMHLALSKTAKAQPAHHTTALSQRAWRYCFLAFVMRAGYFLILNIDLLLISRILGSKEAGLYSAAVALGIGVNLVSQSMVTSLLPRLPKLQTFDEKLQVVVRASRVNALASLVVCVGLWITADWLMAFLFGPAFAEAVLAFRLLLPGLFFLGLNLVLASAYSSSENPIALALTSPLLAVQNILFNLYCLPRYGMVSASINASLTYFLQLVITTCYLLYYRRYLAERIENWKES